MIRLAMTSGHGGLAEALWYFAYGSNMSPAIFLERRAMRPLATRRASLDGHRLCFNLPVGPGERGSSSISELKIQSRRWLNCFKTHWLRRVALAL